MMNRFFNKHFSRNCFSLRGLVDTLSFKSKHAGLEEGLRGSESKTVMALYL